MFCSACIFIGNLQSAQLQLSRCGSDPLPISLSYLFQIKNAFPLKRCSYQASNLSPQDCGYTPLPLSVAPSFLFCLSCSSLVNTRAWSLAWSMPSLGLFEPTVWIRMSNVENPNEKLTDVQMYHPTKLNVTSSSSSAPISLSSCLKAPQTQIKTLSLLQCVIQQRGGPCHNSVHACKCLFLAYMHRAWGFFLLLCILHMRQPCSVHNKFSFSCIMPRHVFSLYV